MSGQLLTVIESGVADYAGSMLCASIPDHEGASGSSMREWQIVPESFILTAKRLPIAIDHVRGNEVDIDRMGANDETDEEEDIPAGGAFIFISVSLPNTSFLSGTIDVDENGFVDVVPGSVETSEPGIFATGNCRKGAIAQVAAATGEGMVASFATIEYLRMRCGPPRSALGEHASDRRSRTVLFDVTSEASSGQGNTHMLRFPGSLGIVRLGRARFPCRNALPF